jgi:energy-converting hydrogenase Eha subunit H
MKKLIIILCGLAIAGSAFAGNVKSYRVYFSTHGSRHITIVQAVTSRDARDTVRHMFPSALVTNVIPVR